MEILCDECRNPVDQYALSGVRGMFCSETCVALAVDRGYPKHIDAALEELDNCFQEAPVDFQSIGRDCRWAERQEMEWDKRWKAALTAVSTYIKGTKE